MIKHSTFPSILSLLAVVVGCSAQPHQIAAPKDLGTNVRYDGLTHFYYLDGADLVRSTCGASAVHDRSTCGGQPGLRVPASPFFASLQGDWETSLAYWEDQARQGEVVVLRLDTQLTALLTATPPNVSAQQLKAQMDAQTATLGQKDTEVADLDNQIAVIKQQLATAEDVDLRLALAKVESQRGDVAAARNQLAADLEQTRDLYIKTAGATLSDETFRNLYIERTEDATKLDQNRGEAAGRLKSLTALSRIMGFMAQDGVTVDVLGGSQAFVDEQKMMVSVEQAFDKTHPDESLAEFRTIASWVALDWSGEWTCQSAFAGLNVPSFRMGVLHIEDVGEPLTGFNIEAVLKIPLETGAVALDWTYQCEFKAAYSVACTYRPDADNVSVLMFAETDFVASSLHIVQNGQTIIGNGGCSKTQ